MKKDQFLELASQLFDQTNPQVEESKIVIDKGTWEEVVDQIGSELFEEGLSLVGDYDLELYGNEITLGGVRLDIRVMEKIISEVLSRYFEIK